MNEAAACDRAGQGSIEVAHVAGRTAVVRCRANSPLKLVTPRATGDLAWVFTSTYGGGLLGGDTIALDVTAGPHARLLLSTQASTKVYPAGTAGCRQRLALRAEPGAVVVSVPDPVVCYAGAAYDQRQRCDVAADAGLVLVDWFTSGRAARGERWAFRSYRSETSVSVDGRVVFHERLSLDPADGPLAAASRMGRVDCFATVVMVGPPVEPIGRPLLEFVAAQPVGRGEVIFAASSLCGGVVVRVAGPDTEAVGRWIRERLGGVVGLLGQDPWARKW